MSHDGRDDDQESGGRWTIRRDPPPVSDDGGPSMEATGPLFHVGCGTLSLAAIIGYPLGAAVSYALFGHQGFGGFLGIFVMMLVFGFFNRRFQVMAEQGARLPGFLGDRVFWASIGIGAFFGFFFGPGGGGLLVGMVLGIAFYVGKRLLRR